VGGDTRNRILSAGDEGNHGIGNAGEFRSLFVNSVIDLGTNFGKPASGPATRSDLQDH